MEQYGGDCEVTPREHMPTCYLDLPLRSGTSQGDQTTEKRFKPSLDSKFSVLCAHCSSAPSRSSELKSSYKVKPVLEIARRRKLRNRDSSQRGRQGLGPSEARDSRMSTGLPDFSPGTSKFFIAT